jgi:hypothetical protein
MSLELELRMVKCFFPYTHAMLQPHFLEECEDDTHTPEMGMWESSGTPKTSKLDCRGQNTSS